MSLSDGVNGDIKATVFDYTNSNPLAVRLTDADGNYVSAGAGTQYTEGDVDATITGTAFLWEDTGDTLRAVSVTKPLPVDITDATIAVTQSGTWNIGTLTSITNAVAVTGTFWQATQPVSIAGTVAVTQSGTWDEVGINDSGNAITVDWAGVAPPIGAGLEATALRVTIATDSTGVLSIDDNGGILTVDGTVTANLSDTDNAVLDAIESDTTAIQTAVELIDDIVQTEDAGHSTGQKGVMFLGVRNDSDVALSGTNLDYTPIATTESGKLIARIEGWDAHDSTDYGRPIKIGGRAHSSEPSAVANNDIVNAYYDVNGYQYIKLGATSNLIGDVGISGARTSGGSTPYKNLDVDETEDAVKASAGQVYWIHAMNTGATPNYLKFYNATVATVVVGTTVPDLTFLVPANADSDGAGFNLAIPNGIAFGTAITIAATLNAADADATAPTGIIIVNLGYA